MNFEQELSRILQEDPLGLLETQPKASVVSADERLLAAFEEINAFFEQHEREPVVGKNIAERRLAKRLEGLKADSEKAMGLKEYDRFNLLGDIQVASDHVEINSIEDLLDGDPLGLLDGNKDSDDNIFQLRNVPENIEMPEKIAKRKPCKDFDKFQTLFQACHHDLKSGVRELHEFTGEQQIAPGHFFILHGVMVYVAEVGDKAKKNGKVNARLRCIFENGTESNMLLRSLATELYKDEGGRRVLDPAAELFADNLKVGEEDQQTGYIYILRSLSEDQRISTIDHLFKVGFSTQPVAKRIANARSEPTYLMADVEVVAEYATYNLNPQKMEKLLHQFFSESCLNLDIFDSAGQRHSPREWFIASLSDIDVAIKLLLNGEIINYQYDSASEVIVERS